MGRLVFWKCIWGFKGAWVTSLNLLLVSEFALRHQLHWKHFPFNCPSKPDTLIQEGFPEGGGHVRPAITWGQAEHMKSLALFACPVHVTGVACDRRSWTTVFCSSVVPLTFLGGLVFSLSLGKPFCRLKTFLSPQAHMSQTAVSVQKVECEHEWATRTCRTKGSPAPRWGGSVDLTNTTTLWSADPIWQGSPPPWPPPCKSKLLRQLLKITMYIHYHWQWTLPSMYFVPWDTC